jgi:hypothetical protein
MDSIRTKKISYNEKSVIKFRFLNAAKFCCLIGDLYHIFLELIRIIIAITFLEITLQICVSCWNGKIGKSLVNLSISGG